MTTNQHSEANYENTLIALFQTLGYAYERGVNDKSFAVIRSKGDQALFRLNTAMLKRKMGLKLTIFAS